MIRIERVSIKNWTLLEQLFGSSPECSECWCMNHRSNPKNCPTGESAKKALREEILSGRAYGLLAFSENRPAGWCAIDPVKTQTGHDYYLQKESAAESDAWMIHCLYVHQKFRGNGISKALIQAAIDLAKENEASELLAFPIPEDSAGRFPKDIAEFSGRLSTFRKFGFEPNERLDDFYQVVSKQLTLPTLPTYSFRPMTEEDLPLLFRWANEPHVRRWWDTEENFEDFRARYIENIKSSDSFPFIVIFDQRPIGYINYWHVEGDQNFWHLFPAGSVGTDQFLGESEMIGKGHGSKFVRQFTDWLLENPAIPLVMTDPDILNAAAIRCYEKAGFAKLSTVETSEGRALVMERRK